MPEDFILTTEGLAKEFRGIVAVDGVDLQVRRGTIHALIGPNGAGKTTCFNLLTKFLSPTAGSITFNGQDITHEKPASIARRGVIRSFQISAVFPHLTVLENVRVALLRRVRVGRTILMVEHNLSVVEGLCDRITVLARGQVLAEGDYATVSKDPRVVEAYIGAGHG